MNQKSEIRAEVPPASMVDFPASSTLPLVAPSTAERWRCCGDNLWFRRRHVLLLQQPSFRRRNFRRFDFYDEDDAAIPSFTAFLLVQASAVEASSLDGGWLLDGVVRFHLGTME